MIRFNVETPKIIAICGALATLSGVSCTGAATGAADWGKPVISKDLFVIPYEGTDTETRRGDEIRRLEGMYECDYKYMGGSGPSEDVDAAYGPASIYACVQGKWCSDCFTVVILRNNDFHGGVNVMGIRNLSMNGNRLENGDYLITFNDYDSGKKLYHTMEITDKKEKARAEAEYAKEKDKPDYSRRNYPAYTPERYRRLDTKK